MPSPQKVVAQALAAPHATPTVEDPLTAQEVAHLKAHFRFLREHRNLLKLRVNAAEDLLLNGVREPSHRGLCNHLLAKVERSRVLTVSQTMPPADAVRFLGGIIRFAPEVGYILRFLECVKLTSSQAQAGAAVTEALKQIDFSELSGAQMRQLVALIVDVFAEQELPIFLLSLLYDAPFRTAIDRSVDGFPAVLAGMVRPLRAVHELVTAASSRGQTERSRDRSIDAQDVKAGVVLLFQVSPLSLVELSESARRRLFQLGCEILRSGASIRTDTLEKLLMSLTFPQAGDQLSAVSALVAAMLASNQESAAKKLIDRVRKPDDTGSQLARWRLALGAPRIGTVALDGARSNHEQPATNRWFRGWHVPTQSVVLVRHGELGEHPIYAEQIALWRRQLVPGASRVVDAAASSDKRPFLAIELLGFPLNRELQKGARIDERVRWRWALDICALLTSFAHQGLALPDADPYRFNSDQDGRLSMVDLWGMRSTSTTEALEVHRDLARKACIGLLKTAPSYSLPADAFERVETASSLAQLANIFDVA